MVAGTSTARCNSVRCPSRIPAPPPDGAVPSCAGACTALSIAIFTCRCAAIDGAAAPAAAATPAAATHPARKWYPALHQRVPHQLARWRPSGVHRVRGFELSGRQCAVGRLEERRHTIWPSLNLVRKPALESSRPRLRNAHARRRRLWPELGWHVHKPVHPARDAHGHRRVPAQHRVHQGRQARPNPISSHHVATLARLHRTTAPHLRTPPWLPRGAAALSPHVATAHRAELAAVKLLLQAMKTRGATAYLVKHRV